VSPKSIGTVAVMLVSFLNRLHIKNIMKSGNYALNIIGLEAAVFLVQ
jgi:hypothetical protein